MEPRPPWLPLGALLLREGLIDAEQLELALLDQERHHRRLGEILVDFGWVSSAAIAHALAEQYGIGFVDLSSLEIDPQAAALLDPALAYRYQALPVAFVEDDVVLVAIGDPTDVGACDELREIIGLPIQLVVADSAELTRALREPASAS